MQIIILKIFSHSSASTVRLFALEVVAENDFSVCDTGILGNKILSSPAY